jgi:hypothetical protein
MESKFKFQVMKRIIQPRFKTLNLLSIYGQFYVTVCLLLINMLPLFCINVLSPGISFVNGRKDLETLPCHTRALY